MDQAFEASRRFFDLPPEVKGQVAVNRHQRGWMQSGLAKLEGAATHDAKEVFFWGWEGADMPANPEKRPPLVHPNQWPEHEAAFLKDGIWPYYQQVMSLGRRVLSALAHGLGQSKTFLIVMRKSTRAGSVAYYPPMNVQDIAQNRLGAAAHTDFGVLTVLMQDMQGGCKCAIPQATGSKHHLFRELWYATLAIWRGTLDRGSPNIDSAPRHKSQPNQSVFHPRFL